MTDGRAINSAGAPPATALPPAGSPAGPDRGSQAAGGAGPAAVAAHHDGSGRAFPPMTPICGEFPIRIARDGTWFYHGSPIGRKPLVRLFARVLARQPDGEYWLATPYERGRIEVDDVPFVAVLCHVRGAGAAQELVFTTNLDEEIRADADHPLIMRGTDDAPAPYLVVRPGLEARLARAVFYQLADLAIEHETGGRRVTGVWSAGHFFPLESMG